ncbi:hypothetical protein HPB50_015728 [Hyalomma asiaticum]|uniref:Uncharacterized protein n=1 Tax=Hyalomma asiaticum TaxID=266040 RepID=A0ACB7SYM6_HYAAI|nr:hypothetical protein HPB50_015728 [Hyalomma asiaticum]
MLRYTTAPSEGAFVATTHWRLNFLYQEGNATRSLQSVERIPDGAGRMICYTRWHNVAEYRSTPALKITSDPLPISDATKVQDVLKEDEFTQCGQATRCGTRYALTSSSMVMRGEVIARRNMARGRVLERRHGQCPVRGTVRLYHPPVN